MATRRSELRVAGPWPGGEPGARRTEVTVPLGHAWEGGDTGPDAPVPRSSVGAIEWVSIPELAVRIGMAKESVYRLARAGRLRGAVKMGRRYVVNYSAFVEASRAPITPAALRS
jgi:excisionase family DNA binding protein